MAQAKKYKLKKLPNNDGFTVYVQYEHVLSNGSRTQHNIPCTEKISNDAADRFVSENPDIRLENLPVSATALQRILLSVPSTNFTSTYEFSTLG